MNSFVSYMRNTWENILEIQCLWTMKCHVFSGEPRFAWFFFNFSQWLGPDTSPLEPIDVKCYFCCFSYHYEFNCWLRLELSVTRSFCFVFICVSMCIPFFPAWCMHVWAMTVCHSLPHTHTLTYLFWLCLNLNLYILLYFSLTFIFASFGYIILHDIEIYM